MKIPPFALERFFAAHEFSAPYLLCASDCEALSVEALLALEPGAEAAFRELWLGYTESSGNPVLRAEIAGLYDSVEADRVLVHSGAEEAIFGFMNAALEPGGHVIVQTPCYQSLTELPRALGFEIGEWPAREEFGWALSLDELERLIRPDTRALVVNLPHNPTGFLAPHAVFERIVEICRGHGLVLFCDEVYRLLEFDPADRLPAACDAYGTASRWASCRRASGSPACASAGSPRATAPSMTPWPASRTTRRSAIRRPASSSPRWRCASVTRSSAGISRSSRATSRWGVGLVWKIEVIDLVRFWCRDGRPKTAIRDNGPLQGRILSRRQGRAGEGGNAPHRQKRYDAVS